MRELPQHVEAVDSTGPNSGSLWFGEGLSCVRHKTRLFAILLFIGIALAAPMSSAVAAQFTEAQVKAAYLFQFGSLVEWPAQKLSSPKDRIVIGVVGNAAVAAELERRARTNEISSHKVTVRRLAPNADFSECHILFIGQEHDAAPILSNVKTPGILTVGEHERFAAGGGVLNFVFVEGAVQYQANLGAAEKARVQLDSRLINVARQRGMIINASRGKESR
ncbi:MAG: YfiR family protein [Verrucomicrobia bacterium]|nr:YfiR family protein [Verrucomicrobiota bacterium]